MLGAPISFSNLGTPITELFQVGEYQILSVAYRQILKYLQTYAAEAKSAFSMEDFSPSKSDLESAERIRSFLESVRQKCRHLWAEFDLFTMTVGACLVRVLTTRDFGPCSGHHGLPVREGLIYLPTCRFRTLI